MVSIDEAPTAGKLNPRQDGLDVPFWEALKQGELRMQRCPKCKTWWWSPVWRCAECGSWDLEWDIVPMRGKVFSWVRTHQAFVPEMKPIVPYANVLVELPDAGGRRLWGILVDSEDGLEIGADLVGVIQQPSELTNNWAVLRWRLQAW